MVIIVFVWFSKYSLFEFLITAKDSEAMIYLASVNANDAEWENKLAIILYY